MKIMLIGLKHCGKSTIGRELSRRWQLPFFDADDLLMADVRQRHGAALSTRDYFIRVGAETFYYEHARQLQKFFSVARPGFVLAAGGGTCESFALSLPADVLTLMLEESPAVIWARVMRQGPPPFLNPELEPEMAFYQMLERRLPQLRRLAQQIYHCRNRPAELICDELEELLADARK